jgi:hypothetical protein
LVRLGLALGPAADGSNWQETCFIAIMVDLAIPANSLISHKRSRFAFFRHVAEWLFSQRHFHFKLLSGTTAGAVVIVFLAGVFLYVTLRNHYQDVLRTHTIEVM